MNGSIVLKAHLFLAKDDTFSVGTQRAASGHLLPFAIREKGLEDEGLKSFPPLNAALSDHMVSDQIIVANKIRHFVGKGL